MARKKNPKTAPVPARRPSSGSKHPVVVNSGRSQLYTFRNSFQAWYIVSQRLPNPDIVLRKKNNAGIEIYRQLYSDAHLTAALESREARTLAQNWEITRNNCPARLWKSIDSWFFSILERKRNIQDLSKEELIDNLLDAIFWGYQPAELVWGYEYGLWLPVQIIPKPPDWFTWFIGQEGIPELRFLSLANLVDGEAPPDEYTLICPRIKPSYDNPYGRGVASRCFWPIVFKKAGLEFWLNFMERFGTPWVKGTMTTGDETAAQSFASDLKNLVQDAVIALTSGRDVELLETSAGSGRISEGFKTMCDFMDSQVSKTILGHTLSTDTQDKGSYAAVKGAMTVRSDLGDADTKMIAATFNDVINLIARRNGYTNVEIPKIRPKMSLAAETERAQRDESLSRCGVRFTKNYYIENYALKASDIDKVVDPSDKQVSTPQVPDDESTTAKNTPGGDNKAKGKE